MHYAEVKVSRSDLAASLAALKKGSRARKKDFATVGFRDGKLEIECGILIQRISANGNWCGIATLPAQCLLDLAGALHAADPITISVRDGRLWIESSSWVCDWKPE